VVAKEVPAEVQEQAEQVRRFVVGMLDSMPGGEGHRFHVSASGHLDESRASVSVSVSCGPA
jgi:hypothetical protein